MTRALVALGALGLVLLFVVNTYAGPSHGRCRGGLAQGFLAIREDPNYLVGTLPSRFTDDARFFERRYNCMRQSAAARRVGLGVYEVSFPGLRGRMAIVTAISMEGVTASVYPMGGGVWRIALRGPLGGDDVASRRDVPFSIAVY